MTIIDMDKMGEALNTKADIDLNNTGVFSTSEGGGVNLTSSTPANASGKEVTSADFFQSNLLNYTTNRILEIPQDIKLELNNGTLTLKAGSKLYVPNGFEADGTTPKFDMAVSEKDISSNSSWTSGQVILIPQKGLTYGIYSSQISNHYSGSTEPATKFDGTIWYDTANNLIKRYSTSNSEWESGLPFPICISTMTSGVGLISIDQIFNGFGYIGSTVFALPGVKVQIPNGRNADGTFKSFIKTTPRVSTWTWDGIDPVYNFIDVNGLVDGMGVETHFDAEKNLWLRPDGAICVIARHNHTPRVENYEPYTVDSVLNSNLSNLSAAGEAKLKSIIQLVNELPANPEPGVLYCIPEK